MPTLEVGNPIGPESVLAQNGNRRYPRCCPVSASSGGFVNSLSVDLATLLGVDPDRVVGTPTDLEIYPLDGLPTPTALTSIRWCIGDGNGHPCFRSED